MHRCVRRWTISVKIFGRTKSALVEKWKRKGTEEVIPDGMASSGDTTERRLTKKPEAEQETAEQEKDCLTSEYGYVRIQQ